MANRRNTAANPAPTPEADTEAPEGGAPVEEEAAPVPLTADNISPRELGVKIVDLADRVFKCQDAPAAEPMLTEIKELAALAGDKAESLLIVAGWFVPGISVADFKDHRISLRSAAQTLFERLSA